MYAKPLDRSTEDQCVRIRVIDAYDSLGYQGAGREEHSGQSVQDVADPFANNSDAPACANVSGCRVLCSEC